MLDVRRYTPSSTNAIPNPIARIMPLGRRPHTCDGGSIAGRPQKAITVHKSAEMTFLCSSVDEMLSSFPKCLNHPARLQPAERHPGHNQTHKHDDPRRSDRNPSERRMAMSLAV